MTRPPATPVIPGFHPDPSICRVGDDYYVACSSFEYLPGIPILHSRDLVHWTRIGNALDRPSQLDLSGAASSGGVYAPTLRHHDGLFWIITTAVAPGAGTFVITASHPAGPWSDPTWLPDVPGIDPDLAWGDDGTCWCTVAGVAQMRIDPIAGRTLDRPTPVWSGTPGAKAPEAPHLYQIGGAWYLMVAEGGTERGHAVSVARGPSPAGPFEPCPDNPIVTHRGSDDPVQNTGHADLVRAADGTWWMLLLGVRTQGGSPGWHVLGRETFLAPVTWRDGWPVVGDLITDVPAPASPWRDDFDTPRLGPEWISPHRWPIGHSSTTERPGWLTVHARGGSLDATDVALVGVRQCRLRSQIRARVDVSAGRGGLAVRLDERHHYEIEAGDGRVRVLARVGMLAVEVATAPLAGDTVTLVVRMLDPRDDDRPLGPRQGPDTIALGVERGDGCLDELAALDGRYLSTEVAGGFTGRVIGLYAARGVVDVDWIDERALDGRETAVAG